MQLPEAAYAYIDGSNDMEDCAVEHHCLPCRLSWDRVYGWGAGFFGRRISWQTVKDLRYRQLRD